MSGSSVSSQSRFHVIRAPLACHRLVSSGVASVTAVLSLRPTAMPDAKDGRQCAQSGCTHEGSGLVEGWSWLLPPSSMTETSR